VAAKPLGELAHGDILAPGEIDRSLPPALGSIVVALLGLVRAR
jgi:hypothetical protein